MEKLEQSQQSLICTSTATDVLFCFSDGKESIQSSTTTSEYHQAQELQMALTPTVNEFVAFEFGNIPEVRSVYTARHDSAFYVRVVVHDDRDSNLRRRIYAKELEMIREFTIFDFDFDILVAPELVDRSLYLPYEKETDTNTLTSPEHLVKAQ